MKLEGKVALVVGTSPNIGGGIAEGFAREGARVVCVDFEARYAHGCAETLSGKGYPAVAVVCDATQEEQVTAAVDTARQAFGGVDILVNGAAFFNWKGVLEMPLDEWRHQVDVILTSAFLFTKHAVRLMVEQKRKGCVINILSTAAHQGEPWNVAYCTGKGGLLNFTRSTAMELAEYGIRVNSLTPTATDRKEGIERAVHWGVEWPRHARGRGAPAGNALESIPLRRLPHPSHHARAAVFLASDDAEMITGADLRVDGGALARYWTWQPKEGDS